MQPPLGGSSMSSVHFERTAHRVPLGGVSADQRRCVVRGGVEPPTFRFSGGRSYRLSYLTEAVLTGFEPATSTLTGWRALRLLYRTMLPRPLFLARKSISPTLLWLPRLNAL